MPKERKPASHRLRVVLIILLVLLATGIIAARQAGRWLVREDPLAHADVIVVLSGGIPYRAEAAAKLFRLGYAPAVWVSHPEGPEAALKELGIHFVGEEEYNREILIQQGVPESAAEILPGTIVDTEQEMAEVAREMRRTGKTSVIIVTSPQHTRRVKALWKRIVGDNPKLIVRAAPDDPFDADHWWRNTHDVFAAVREYMGLANAWAGLPVRPHSP